MTQDEIIEMAREVGGSDVGGPGWTTWVGTQSTEFLERFAKLVAAKTLAQTQEPVPPPWWPAVENILNEYGLQAVDFVADFKQALAQTQEPVAWRVSYPIDPELGFWFAEGIGGEGCLNEHLYTLPPQRTWVGLTDKEITALLMPFPKYPSEWDDPDFYRLTQAIEAKLKEKNK